MKQKLSIKPVQHDRINIGVDADIDRKQIILSFDGNIDMQTPGDLLDPLFDQAHHDMIHLSLEEIVMDFQNLDFMNSSGIKAVAKLIMKQTSLSQDQKYTIRILQNKKSTWQTTSLPTLTFLLPGVVKIE